MLFSLLFWGRRLHRFSIDFGRVFWCICDGFWMTSPSAHPPGKTFKFDDPSDEFACFYPSGKHVFACFPQAFLVPFVHWFWMSFGIDFGSNLGGIWHTFSMVFGIEFQLISQWFFKWFLQNFWGQKWVQKRTPIFPRICAEPESVQGVILGRFWTLF